MIDKRIDTVANLCHVVTILMLAGDVALVAATWDRLPERIPRHFGASGIPDRWGAKGELLGLLAVPFFLTAMMYGLTLLVPLFRRNPKWVNVPNKEAFLALGPEQREPFWASLRDVFLSLAAGCNLVLFGVSAGTILVALGRYDRLPWWGVWPGLVLVFGLVAVNLVRMVRVIPRVTSVAGPRR